MRTTRILKAGVLTAACVLTVAALSSPSQADSAKKSPAPPPEEGCFNILGGEATMSRHSFIELDPDGTSDATVTIKEDHGPDAADTDLNGHTHGGEKSVDLYRIVGTNDAEVSPIVTTAAGDAQDCSASRYRLRLSGEGGRLISEVVLPGAVGNIVPFRTFVPIDRLEVATNGDRYAFLTLSAETADGAVADTAAGEAALTLDGGGATSYGG